MSEMEGLHCFKTFFFFVSDEAEAAFYFCAYEFAIKSINSPWCKLFDETDAKVLIDSESCQAFKAVHQVCCRSFPEVLGFSFYLQMALRFIFSEGENSSYAESLSGKGKMRILI